MSERIQEDYGRDSEAMDDVLAKDIIDTIIEKSQGM